MKTWLFTNTFYGTWLPGDPRGSVTRIREHRIDDDASHERIEHNQFGTPTAPSLPALESAARQQMKGPPILMDLEKAELLLAHFRETAQFRKWSLICAAVMWNHIHWIAKITDSTPPDKALADFKAYGSRALNAKFGRPQSGT